MTTPTEDLLRRLLPRFFWLRDAEDGDGTLAALVDVLAAQYDRLRLDVDVLYDQVFLATCDPEYVPLIGDGIGVSGLAPVTGPGVADRAWVGRVIGLRRRKGMLATVGRGTTAATGWAAYVQEGRAVVATTRSVRPDGFAGGVDRLLDVAGGGLVDLTAPWSTAGRSATISGRPIVAGEPTTDAASRHAGGGPAPATTAVSVWRLMSFPVRGRTARPAHDAPDEVEHRAFRFDPLGRDTRLFANPVGVRDRLAAPDPAELPLPLTVPLLARVLAHADAARRAPVRIEGHPRLVAGDLREWRLPPGTHDADAVVDPLRGRFLLTHAHGEHHHRRHPLVDYAYGLPGEIGGGPYGAPGTDAVSPRGAQTLHVVGADERLSRAAPGTVASLDEALADAGGGSAAIVIQTSATQVAPRGRWEIVVPAGAELRIASATEAAPVLEGDLHVRVPAGARFDLCGLTLHGTLRVDGAGTLAVEHCTLAPHQDEPACVVDGEIALTAAFVIAGAIRLGRDVHAALGSSIVHGLLAGGAALTLEQVTALHEVRVAHLLAHDCLFARAVRAEAGTVATSHLPAGSEVQRVVACTGPADGRPRFTSTRPGDPAYGQLALRCPRPIAHAAARGGEPGAYGWLGQPERFARLPIVLHELLPAGIGASLHYVN